MAPARHCWPHRLLGRRSSSGGAVDDRLGGHRRQGPGKHRPRQQPGRLGPGALRAAGHRRRSPRPRLGDRHARGTKVPAHASLASEGSSRVRRTAILAIDVSRSMARDGKFAAAKRAAESLPAVDPVQRVRRDRVVRGVGAHPASRPAWTAAARGRSSPACASRSAPTSTGASRPPWTSPGSRASATCWCSPTAATPRALGHLGRSPGRSGPARPRRRRGARASRRGTSKLLAPLSTAGHGRVISADDASELTDVFSSQARVLANELVVTVTPPAGSTARDGTLSVSVAAGGTTYSDSAFVRSAPRLARRPAPASSRSPPTQREAAAAARWRAAASPAADARRGGRHRPLGRSSWSPSR